MIHVSIFPLGQIIVWSKSCFPSSNVSEISIVLDMTDHADFIQVNQSGTGSSEHLAGPGLESSRTASVYATSEHFCFFLC